MPLALAGECLYLGLTHAMTLDEVIHRLRELLRRDAERLKVPMRTVASPSQIAACEKVLALPLPLPYARMLCEVANGGFGPWIYGIPPNGYADRDAKANIVKCYLQERSWPLEHRLPRGLLPIRNWGCYQFSYLDLLSGGAIVTSEDHPGDGPRRFVRTADDLTSWLAQWLDGADLYADMYRVLGYQDELHPITKKPHRYPVRELKGDWLDFGDRM